jgi:hypothetical protein
MDYVLQAETGYINFSPVGFRLVARDFRRCADAFMPLKFSIVPYFLYCRAIELRFVVPADEKLAAFLERVPARDSRWKRRTRPDRLRSYSSR